MENARHAKALKRQEAMAAQASEVQAEPEAQALVPMPPQTEVPPLPQSLLQSLAGDRFDCGDRKALQLIVRHAASCAPQQSDGDAGMLAKLHKSLIGIGASRVSTKVALADALGVRRQDVRPRLCQLAEAAGNIDHDTRALLGALLSRCLPPEDLLMYIDSSRSDETPLKMGIGQAPAAVEHCRPATLTRARMLDMACLHRLLRHRQVALWPKSCSQRALGGCSSGAQPLGNW